MHRIFYVFLSIVLSSLIPFTISYSADFNIKLRKTDINDLKQQLMPVFEQNVTVLTDLLYCLETGKTVDVCLSDSSPVDDNKNELNRERSEQISKKISNYSA
ncbi:MAG: hypothetical protein KZQ64_01365 [gamma proteobacterium symbiont of Bathyaustriella thionipta]|nr:hypothetical protein [gamma proteobacterium symbiont of Bathyaustriella thionipta]MCU7950214.1 hypothetical protein [gamma proteobacterium symbiont of Bathyaustriella thionipta]MCU7952044.1 hypothetical protein [gamma proteobacterium symbiont of Bathyaustriella thionipta]MCU7956844.1 hypothetical protein [gamma proteobacterium symbiont of Bathyaustriella thionipta]MCU7967175.1 hypothetical protein [gamma proteobacterium symbiont of Bathyaustriella thionipta]